MTQEGNYAAAHQPSKAELEDYVSIDATAEAVAWTLTRGGVHLTMPKGSNRRPISHVSIAQ